MGMPIVVCKKIGQRGFKKKIVAGVTYVDGQVQQIKTTRIRTVSSIRIHRPLRNPTRIQLNAKLPTTEHTHQQVCNMHQHAAHHLFRDIEEPDLQRSLRSFSPSLVYQCHQRQES